MKRTLNIILISLSAFSVRAFGATTQNQIQQMILSQPASHASKLSTNGSVIALEPDSNSCVDEACRFSSCSLDSDTKDFAQACGANTSSNCVREACNRTGCTFKADVIKTIRACNGNVGGDCVQEVCSRIGCNFDSEAHEIARACKLANGGCVRSVCIQTGCSLKANALDAIHSCTSSTESSGASHSIN